jgi:hypothetical protein
MTPYMLTIGTVMSVPRTRDSARRRISRRMISTPFSSSPCTAEHTNSVGPARFPRLTCTGMVMGVWV